MRETAQDALRRMDNERENPHNNGGNGDTIVQSPRQWFINARNGAMFEHETRDGARIHCLHMFRRRLRSRELPYFMMRFNAKKKKYPYTQIYSHTQTQLIINDAAAATYAKQTNDK